MKIILFLLLLVSFVGCKEDATTPEGLLNKFVVDITTKKLDRDYFDKYTTGKMLESIEQLNEDEFEKFSNLANAKDPKIEVSKKNCSDSRCSLTYVVKYDYHIKKQKEFKTEVKKLATLVKDGEIWKIEEVSNLKTYHEATNPINVQ